MLTPAVVSISKSYGPKVDTVDFEVGASFADAAVTSGAFAAVKFVGCAMHPDQEHV